MSNHAASQSQPYEGIGQWSTFHRYEDRQLLLDLQIPWKRGAARGGCSHTTHSLAQQRRQGWLCFLSPPISYTLGFLHDSQQGKQSEATRQA
jgi:hypothetical protein